MPDLRTFEISYTKNDERKSFIEQAKQLYQNDEWRLVAQKSKIALKDLHRGEDPQTWKSMCIDAGYTDVTFVEIP